MASQPIWVNATIRALVFALLVMLYFINPLFGWTAMAIVTAAAARRVVKRAERRQTSKA